MIQIIIIRPTNFPSPDASVGANWASIVQSPNARIVLPIQKPISFAKQIICMMNMYRVFFG